MFVRIFHGVGFISTLGGDTMLIPPDPLYDYMIMCFMLNIDLTLGKCQLFNIQKHSNHENELYNYIV